MVAIYIINSVDKTKLYVILPPMQHHSFVRNLTPLFIYLTSIIYYVFAYDKHLEYLDFLFLLSCVYYSHGMICVILNNMLSNEHVSYDIVIINIFKNQGT